MCAFTRREGVDSNLVPRDNSALLEAQLSVRVLDQQRRACASILRIVIGCSDRVCVWRECASEVGCGGERDRQRRRAAAILFFDLSILAD